MSYMKTFYAYKHGTRDLIKVDADYYLVAEALNHTPIMAHCQKNLWDAGNRNGGKSYEQDVREIKDKAILELTRITEKKESSDELMYAVPPHMKKSVLDAVRNVHAAPKPSMPFLSFEEVYGKPWPNHLLDPSFYGHPNFKSPEEAIERGDALVRKIQGTEEFKITATSIPDKERESIRANVIASIDSMIAEQAALIDGEIARGVSTFNSDFMLSKLKEFKETLLKTLNIQKAHENSQSSYLEESAVSILNYHKKVYKLEEDAEAQAAYVIDLKELVRFRDEHIKKLANLQNTHEQVISDLERNHSSFVLRAKDLDKENKKKASSIIGFLSEIEVLQNDVATFKGRVGTRDEEIVGLHTAGRNDTDTIRDLRRELEHTIAARPIRHNPGE